MRARPVLALVSAVLVATLASGCTSGPRAVTANSGSTTGEGDQNGSSAGGTVASRMPGKDAVSPVDLDGVLPKDRQAVWDPGLNAVGGIPKRSKTCANVSPGGGDDTATIQHALDACPAGQVVQLEAGTFHITGQGLAMTRSQITLRGRGSATRLVKPTGTGFPVIIIGLRWYKYTQPVDFAAAAAQGARSVTLKQNPGLAVGEIVTVDQTTNPQLTRWGDRSPPGNVSRGWFGRYDRPIGQVMEIKSISGDTVSFTTPLHTAFPLPQVPQLVRFSNDANGTPQPAVESSGIEDLYVSHGEGGDGGGNIHLYAAAYSWVAGVESGASSGSSVNLDACFRCVLRDSYLHSTVDPNPGGAGYGIALDDYAADNLVENNISWNFNKVIVMRTTGGGNVIGYNYMEDGWGAGYRTIVEVGLNASHMTTPHYELFEGNQSFNFDSDSVWGNAIDITVFRNDLTGQRRSIPPLQLTDMGNRRAIGLTIGHWWYSFIGNVLGSAGQIPPPGAAFVYETSTFNDDSVVPMWRLGYDGEDGSKPQDQKVVQTTIRNGNFDYVTNQMHWASGMSHALPPSLYLTSKPVFFGSMAWPWVTPDGANPVAQLPARVRFDAIAH
jgi:hypothetical protein